MKVFVLLFSLLMFVPLSHAGGDEENTEPEMIYLEMKPKITVNLAEPRKYMVVNVQLLVEGEKAKEKVEKHMPLLRHTLIMMYSGQSSAKLQTMEQREALRINTKEAIENALEKYANKDGFRDVYFTEFLIN